MDFTRIYLTDHHQIMLKCGFSLTGSQRLYKKEHQNLDVSYSMRHNIKCVFTMWLTMWILKMK